MHDPGKEAQPYQDLTPDLILDAVESFGVRVSGSILALNSYENRVYQIGLEEGAPLVAKFYRPGRWSNAAILEEHAFALELAEHEIPVVAPLQDAEGRTLLEYGGYRFALFPRRGAAGRSWTIPTISCGSGASSAASTPWARSGRSSTVPPSPSSPSAPSRCAT